MDDEITLSTMVKEYIEDPSNDPRATEIIDGLYRVVLDLIHENSVLEWENSMLEHQLSIAETHITKNDPRQLS